jgi:hypothetical protein
MVLLILLYVAVVCLFVNKHKIERQEQQIKQLNQMMITLVESESAIEKTGFELDKEYCFFFADYDRSLAVVGEFDGEICYDKNPVS